MLDLFQQNQDIAARPAPEEGRDLPATFGESYDAAWANGQVAVSGIKEQNARERAINDYADRITRAGGDVETEYRARARAASLAPGGLTMNPIDSLDIANSALTKLKARNPTLDMQPMTEDDIAKATATISKNAIATAGAMGSREQTFGSRVGGFLGGAASAGADPYNIPAVLIAPESELGILGTAGLMGATQAAGQIANETVNARYNREIGVAGDAPENVLAAGISGAVLGGTAKAIGHVLTRLATGEWPQAARDAANVLRSESHIEGSNVLPGVEGEAEHRVAIAKSIDQILKGDAVDPEIAAAGRDVMERAQREQAFIPPHFDAAEISRISDEATLKGRAGELETHLASLAKGDPQAAETLARVEAVEKQIAEAATPAEKRALSQRRDELLADTNPETLRAAAAPIEQRRVAESEQASIAGRLKDIEAEREQARLDHAIAGTPPQQPLMSRVPQAAPPTLFDIHTGRLDAIMGMREGIKSTPEASPELPHRAAGLSRGVKALAELGGHDMPAAEVEALSERIIGAKTDDEAQFILNQITDRPRTLLGTLPSPSDFAAAIRDAKVAAPAPATMTTKAMQETLKSPEVVQAMRADVERAIDAAAKEGKAPQVPVGVDAEGNPIFRPISKALDEIDAYKALADQIAQCALPAAMQAEE